MHYDVIVCGGGISGVAAAVSAAREGKQVLLLERSGMLGGLATGGSVSILMSSLRWFSGFGKELIDSLVAEGSAWRIPDPAVKGFDYYPNDPEAMKLRLEHLVDEAGVELFLYTTLCLAKTENGRITGITFTFGGRNYDAEASVYIDTPGDGSLCRLAGEALLDGDVDGNVQAPTMVSRYSGIDFNRYEAFLQTYEDGKRPAKINMIHDLVPKAVEAGILKHIDLHHPGIFRYLPDSDGGIMNAGHVYGADVFTPKGLTAATLEGRRQANALLKFYKTYIPGFENATLTNTGELALRESGRVVCEYMVTFEDKTNYQKFSDGIMRFDGGAVSDVHASSGSPEAYRAYVKLYADRENVRRDDWAELPYRCLLPKQNSNLLVAGRCAGADRRAMGQIRLQSYCASMGQVAGVAAAMAEHGNVKTLDVLALQRRLRTLGVEV